MLVRVLIERHIKEGHEAEAADMILEMRKQATSFPGYVSGVTLTDTADARTIVIVSTWHSREEWQKWDSSEEHRAAAKNIALPTNPEQIEGKVNGVRIVLLTQFLKKAS